MKGWWQMHDTGVQHCNYGLTRTSRWCAQPVVVLRYRDGFYTHGKTEEEVRNIMIDGKLAGRGVGVRVL